MANQKSKKIISLFFFFAVLLFFVCYNSFYLPHKKTNYGRSDFTIFYIAGSSITHKLAITPNQIYQKKYIKPVVHQLRIIKGGTKFLYPPQSALLFAPLTIFSYSLANKIWLIINCLIYLLAYYLSVYLVDKKIYKISYSLVLLLLTFADTTYQLFENGQINGFVWLCIAGSLALIKMNKKYFYLWSGSLLGAAIVIKIFPIIIWPYLIIKKQWRVLFSSIILCLGMTIISFIFFDWHAYQIYINEILFKYILNGNIAGHVRNISFYGTLYLDALRAVPKFYGLSKHEFKTFLSLGNQIIAITVLLAMGIIFFIRRKKKNFIYYFFEVNLLILFTILFSKGVHASYNIFTITSLLYFFSFPLKKKNVILYLIGLGLLITSQSWSWLPISGLSTFYMLRIQNIGLFLLLLAFAFFGTKYWQEKQKSIC